MLWSEIEALAVAHAMSFSRHDKRAAARLLGVSPTTLYGLIARYGAWGRSEAVPPKTLAEIRRLVFRGALVESCGSSALAADSLGVSIRTVQRMRKKL